jgi:hypothetical protein
MAEEKLTASDDLALEAGGASLIRLDGGEGNVEIGAAATANSNTILEIDKAMGAVSSAHVFGTIAAVHAYRTADENAALTAVVGDVYIPSTGNTANWTGVAGMRAVQTQVRLAGGTGTVTGGAGVYAVNAVVTGMTLTNQYGMYFEDLTTATNNYYFGFAASDTAAAGSYKGRIPIEVAGTAQYLHYYDF